MSLPGRQRRWASLVLAAAIGALTAAGCAGDDSVDPGPPASATRDTPVPGGTPAPTAPAPPVRERGYRAVEAIPRASFPLMLAMIPIPGDGSHAAVVTKDGMIYRVNVDGDSEEPSVFLDLRGQLKKDLANEEGLLGLAFAPDYESSARLYVNYTAGEPRRTIVSRFIANGDVVDRSSERVLLAIEDPFGNHNGGALVFGPDGMLYISLGDGGSQGDPLGNGQSTTDLFASILRIDVSGEAYTVPPDNPFVAGGGAGEVWAYGLRNPWRISFDRATGDLWAADVGGGRWEEIDLIVRGGNYGWSITEGPDCYNADECDRDELQAPRAWYGHDEGCSVTGGYVYRGAAMPELDGWYIYGDYCSGRVWGFDADTVTSEPVVLLDTEKAISSFAEDIAGELYLVTFDEAIYRLERAE